jgi:putative tricarboxylic transport membrane protein
VAETVLNLIWIALGLAIAALAPRYTILGPAGPGGGFLPLVTGLMIAGCGLALLLRAAPQPQGIWPAFSVWLRMGLIVGGLAAITLLMPYLGFILTVMPIMVVLIQAVDRRSWWTAVLTSAIATLSIYVLFTRLLAIALPRGPLGF